MQRGTSLWPQALGQNAEQTAKKFILTTRSKTMASSMIPFGPGTPTLFSDFRREIDNLMSRFFEGDGGEATSWFSPQANIAETEQQFEITVDVPGMKPDDITIELRQGDLWITGERKHEEEQKERTYHRIERRYGRFQRVIHLGTGVDADKIEADYKDGVLHIAVPKTEAAQPKRINVKS
jgi:HSP20 family protein